MSAPSAPQILIKPRSSPQTLEFSWEPPASDGGSPITGYRLTLSYTAPLYPGPTERYYRVTGLTNGLTYDATLEATNDGGATWSPAASFLSWQPGTQPTTPPSTVTAQSLGVSSALVAWTPPAVLPDATIFWYVVTSISNNGGDPVLRLSGDGLLQTDLVIDGLNPTSQYSFTVQAVTCAGYSPPRYTSTVGSLPIDTTGLLAHFDAATYTGAGSWTDRSSNARVASVAAGTPAKTPQGNAVSFDGTLYYSFSNMIYQPDWSVMFWFKRRGQQGRAAILTEQLTSNINMYASFYAGGGAPSSTAVRGGWYDGAFVNGAAIPFTDEAWTSMCVTWDNTSKELNTYANHSNVSTMQLIQVDTYPGLTPSSSGFDYYIGADWSLEGTRLVGDLGEIAIYNRALASNEVISNFAATKPKYITGA